LRLSLGEKQKKYFASNIIVATLPSEITLRLRS